MCRAHASCRQGQRAPVLSLTSSPRTLKQVLHPPCSQSTLRVALLSGASGRAGVLAGVLGTAHTALSNKVKHSGASQKEQQRNEHADTNRDRVKSLYYSTQEGKQDGNPSRECCRLHALFREFAIVCPPGTSSSRAARCQCPALPQRLGLELGGHGAGSMAQRRKMPRKHHLACLGSVQRGR